MHLVKPELVELMFSLVILACFLMSLMVVWFEAIEDLSILDLTLLAIFIKAKKKPLEP